MPRELFTQAHQSHLHAPSGSQLHTPQAGPSPSLTPLSPAATIPGRHPSPYGQYDTGDFAWDGPSPSPSESHVSLHGPSSVPHPPRPTIQVPDSTLLNLRLVKVASRPGLADSGLPVSRVPSAQNGFSAPPAGSRLSIVMMPSAMHSQQRIRPLGQDTLRASSLAQTYTANKEEQTVYKVKQVKEDSSWWSWLCCGRRKSPRERQHVDLSV
ncbi:hypothetical protein AX16_007094 [Volvariella volvacea WC 439]|nr:hypothetical protein AX16_007094 [Volvariella volvacea WC 439]